MCFDFSVEMKQVIMKICLLLLAMINLSSSTRCSNRVLFGTKTPYKLVENRDTNVLHPNGCFPIQINMVYRHGNRYPTRQDVRNMNPLIKKINKEYKKAKFKSNLRFTDVNITFPLTQPFDEELDTHLSEIGEQEMYDIGQRLKIRYPSIFNITYSPLHYSFLSSCKLRCTHSSNALASGLFENKDQIGKCNLKTVAVDVLPCDRDHLMRFLDNCERYKRKVVAREKTYYEDSHFAEGKEVANVIEKVKKKLRLDNLVLTHYNLHMLFTLCSYEIGMFQGSLDKGYCSLFDTEDKRVLEYWYDMRNYYKRANPKVKVTYRTSCKLLTNVLNTLKIAKESYTKKYYQRAIFRSGHSKTIIPFFNLLKLFINEQPLKFDNYAKMQKREFHTGCSSPFSGNLYFVLYKCSNDKFKIQLNVNEKPMRIPCCDNELSCDFDTFLSCYKSAVESCHYKRRCKLRKEK